MTENHPFIRQIDHVGVRARDPRPLFSFFCDVLQLPVAFPYTEYANYTSGSVALGNCFLEIMRFGAPLQNSVTHNQAGYFILGFLLKEGTLAASLSELDRRQISHGAPVPFFDPEATDENPVQIWANVYLGRLLGENGWLRLLFAMTSGANPTPSMMKSPLLNTVSLWMMGRAFKDGMPVLTEYYRHRESHRRAISRDTLAERQGGLLGVERVEEVVVETRDPASWERLLAPLAAGEDGAYRPGLGPAVRPIAASAPGIRTIALKVASLARAKAALEGCKIRHAADGRRLSFTIPDSQGLSVQLIE